MLKVNHMAPGIKPGLDVVAISSSSRKVGFLVLYEADIVWKF
jgi:hypothetical protein